MHLLEASSLLDDLPLRACPALSSFSRQTSNIKKQEDPYREKDEGGREKERDEK